MATRRFCDICDAPLFSEDDKPFVRSLKYGGINNQKALASVLITNENFHALTDVCNRCKLRVVNEGETASTESVGIATLQLPVAADVPPLIKPFRSPETPPPVPTPNYEPSLKTPPAEETPSPEKTGVASDKT